MRIHRNLHNAKRGGPQWVHTSSGRVSAYLESVCLTDVCTRIQPAAQAKCATSQVRSVCAFFDGNQTETPHVDVDSLQVVSYDPRCDTQFMADGKPWNYAEIAILAPSGKTYVLNPTFLSDAQIKRIRKTHQ